MILLSSNIISTRKWMTSANHDGTKSSGIPIIHTFTHSIHFFFFLQFIYSFYKNYLPGSDLGTREIKQGAKQGSLSAFPSLQVRVTWLLMLDSGPQRALWRKLSDSQDLAKNWPRITFSSLDIIWERTT